MAISKTELFFLEEIFSKLKYDRMNNRYYIALEDYDHLKLEGSQLTLLKRMCQENNIYLETLPKQLKMYQTRKLFEEYHRIKESIAQKPELKDKLQDELYDIQNQIVKGHMRIIYRLINKLYPNIENIQDKDDIYQTGYLKLIEFVEKYDHTKNVSFIYYIKTYIMHYIIHDIYKSNDGLKEHEIESLGKINKARKELSEKHQEITIENLSKITGYSEEKIKSLLILEKILNPSYIESPEDRLFEDLISYDQEDKIIDNILEETDYLHKLIEALPIREKIVIKLRYGFEDGKTHTYEEIAKKIGNISYERVRQIKEAGLELLANFIGSNYLKDIHGNTKYSKKIKDCIKSVYDSQKSTADLLINASPKETVLSILKNLDPINKEIMLLYYGLKDGRKYNIKEISKIIGLSQNTIKNRKETSTNIVIKGLAKKINPSFNGNYLEFLMNNYLNTPKTKKKR